MENKTLLKIEEFCRGEKKVLPHIINRLHCSPNCDFLIAEQYGDRDDVRCTLFKKNLWWGFLLNAIRASRCNECMEIKPQKKKIGFYDFLSHLEKEGLIIITNLRA